MANLIKNLSELALARRLEEAGEDEAVPLCVDLDGTLVRTDTLHESVLEVLRRRPYMIFALPFWLLSGRAGFKAKVAAAATLDPATLPYRRPLLSFLRREAARGRRLVLVTAAHETIAHGVANHLGCFADVIASDGKTNLKGEMKARELGSRYGAARFDYAGDSRADLPVWACARKAIVVAPSRKLLRHGHWQNQTAHVLEAPRPSIQSYIKAIRIHQWTKNVLVFLPLLAGHRVTELPLLVSSYIAFVAFCVVASAGYVINDLMDLAADRAHPRKRRRPFASGRLPLTHGAVLVVGLLAVGFGLAVSISAAFAAWLGLYLVFTLTYSFWLKRKVLIDVFVLAELYTHRIIAGAIATSIAPSYWLLAFSTFFFLSLAMLKRYAELVDQRATRGEKTKGRGYLLDDLDTIVSLGTASGYVSVLVLALYVNSPNIQSLYRSPELVWFVCPVLLYWISRTWIGAGRGKMHDDPLVFAVRDRISRNILGFCFLIVLTAWLVKLPCMPWGCG